MATQYGKKSDASIFISRIFGSFTLYMPLLSIAGCFLNMYKLSVCWLIWTCGSLGFAYYFTFKNKDYGAATLWWFYVGFNMFGYAKWEGWI